MVFLLVSMQCLSPLDFNAGSAGGRLVISGQISTLAEQNNIQLSRTTNRDQLPAPVSNAMITLYDDEGNFYSYAEDFSKKGIYRLSNVSGMPGRAYYIEVILADNKVYTSQPEIMPESSGLNSVDYKIASESIIDSEGDVVDNSFLKIYVNSSVSTSFNNNSYLKWSVQETFILSPTNFPDIFGRIPDPCYIDQNASPQQITLFNGTSIASKAIDNYLIASRQIDWSFLEKHYFTVYQSSITEASHEYWVKVNILANQSGSLFDTPPAEIKGNIISSNPSEEVAGFFQAVNQSYQRFHVLPENLPFPLLVETCTFKGDPFDVTAPQNREVYPARCIDCASLPNSSFTRPEWF